VKLSFRLVDPKTAWALCHSWLEPAQFVYAAACMFWAGEMPDNHRYFSLMEDIEKNVCRNVYLVYALDGDNPVCVGYICWHLGMTGVYLRPEWRGRGIVRVIREQVGMQPPAKWERQAFLSARPGPA
jgi:hypothetical protein